MNPRQFVKFKSTYFSQGSVRVKVQIDAEGHNATELQEAINEQLANNGGRIGDYSVDPQSISVVQAIGE